METPPNKQYSNISYGPFKAVIYTIAAFFGSQLIATVAVVLLALFLGQRVEDGILDNELTRFSFSVITGGLSVYLVHALIRSDKNNLKDIGLKNFESSAAVKAVMAFGAYFLSLAVVLGLVSYLFPGFNLEQEQQIGFSSLDSTWILFFSLVVIPPIAEEIMMRGLLFTGVRSKLSFSYATIITSIVFALAHLPAAADGLHWPAAVDTFLLSIFLCYLREKTDSLLAPMLLHALKNFVALLFLVGVLA